MSRVYKSRKFNLFGITVFIRISYPVKSKSSRITFPFYINRKIFWLTCLTIVFMMLGIFVRNYFDYPAYVTRTSPFLEELSPVLGKEKKASLKPIISKQDKIVFHGPRDRKQVALTFDADMTPEMKYDLALGAVESYYDRKLIKILNTTNTKATLFLSGMWIENYANEAKTLAGNPLFELGNHTYSHSAFDGACYGLTLAHHHEKKDELIKTQKLLKKLSGFDNKLFRFPGGCYSEIDLDLVSRTGQVSIQWDVAAQDGFNTDTSNIINNVVENAKNGSIVVMHMNGYPNDPVTADVLPTIISALRQKGFEFVTVSELLNVNNSDATIIPHLAKLLRKNTR